MKETISSKGESLCLYYLLFSCSFTPSPLHNFRYGIEELIGVGLLTRQQRSHKSSFLFIEDISETEKNRYLEKYVYKNKKEETLQKSIDKNVNREIAGRLTKMSVDNNKEEEKKKNEINVNENLKIPETIERSGMQGMRDILKRFDIEERETKKGRPKKEKPERILKRNYLADEIAQTFGDQKSLGAFRKIAELVPEEVIRECLAEIKETWREGKIKKSRGALFVSMIQQYAEAHHDLPPIWWSGEMWNRLYQRRGVCQSNRRPIRENLNGKPCSSSRAVASR